MKATFNALASPIYLASRKERFGIRHAQCLSRPVSVGNYSPFGVTLHNRDLSLTSGSGNVPYRYGYQGSEMDDEVKGEGNSYTTFFRQLDPRLGRWLSIDPKASAMPWQSPYCSMDNNPIKLNDISGDISDKKHKRLLKEQQKLKDNGEKLSKREKKWAENYIRNHGGVLQSGADEYGNTRYSVKETFNEPGIGDLPGGTMKNGVLEKEFANLNDKQEKNLTALYGFKYKVGEVIGVQVSFGLDFYVFGGASYSIDNTFVGGEVVTGYTVGGGLGVGTGVGTDAVLIVCTEAGRYNAEKIQEGKGFSFSVDVGAFSFSKSGDFEDDEAWGFKWDGSTNNGYGGSLAGADFGKKEWEVFYQLVFRSVNAIKFKVEAKYEWTKSGTYIRW